MKIVIGSYDYEGLIKSYLNQNKKYATTASGRLWYRNKYLYSYNTKIAEILNDNILLVDSNATNYSITTSKQVNQLKKLNTKYIIIDVVDLNAKTIVNWHFIDDLIQKYKRARVQHKLDEYAYNIKNYYNQILWQLDYFKIDKRTKQYKYKNKVYKQLFELKLL